MSEQFDILVVDDDASLQRVLEAALDAEGYGVTVAASAEAAGDALAGRAFDLVVLDLNLPGLAGLDALAAWRAAGHNMPVVVLTAQNTVENAIRAMQLGAYDYVTKPFDLGELYGIVGRALASSREVVADDRTPAAGEDSRSTLVGTSPAMQEVYKVIGKMAATDATVLILGESGTGKELVAKAVHDYSTRREGPFVALNTTAIPAELLEAELFGYEKGAFTGAVQAAPGRFREAAGGTLLLDEIGDMPLGLQAKLLRVLQEREITPLGGRRAIPIDVRVIAATQVSLEQAVAEGRFRADLYYRLRVVEVHLPPLRERTEDILALADLFLRQMAIRGEIPPKRIGADALALLQTAPWPGNVRQLENLVRRVALLSPHRTLDTAAFRQFGGEFPRIQPGDEGGRGFARLVEQHLRGYVEAMHDCGEVGIWPQVVGTIEAVLLKLALEVTDGNQLRAADLLGINRNTIRKKLTEYEIDPRQFRGREG